MDQDIIIIGAGLAGLVAAKHIEAAGGSPLILEASDRVGGRVKTDVKDGFKLDRGFQVLLTGYAEAQEYLDFAALDLRSFQTGARIFADGRSFLIADPLRDPAQVWRMVFSPVGSLLDKIKMWQLTQQLKRLSPSKNFDHNHVSTLDYLQKEWGFSDRIIRQFFKPFFGGIFLENALLTPASMFRFV
jgi:phytoene dehydrogenase-like protein